MSRHKWPAESTRERSATPLPLHLLPSSRSNSETSNHAFLALTPVWPSSISRAPIQDGTAVTLYTGAEWSGRFEGDVCTLIYQVVGEIA